MPWLRAPDRFYGRQFEYSLVRCMFCTGTWLLNAPAACDMNKHYGALYERAITTGRENPKEWSGRRDELFHHKSGGTLLDIGCSSGGFLSAIKGPSWKLLGIEMSADMADRARSLSGADVFVGDVLDATFPAESVDAITCFHVLEHFHQPRAVIRRAFEWLKPGGILYMMVPNIDSAGARLFRSYWYALEVPRHIYHFSPTSLSALCQTEGFQQVSVTTHRQLFIEPSVRYIIDDIYRKLAHPRTPMADDAAPGIPWKVVRRLFRLSALPVLTRLGALAGPGESIHAVYSKGTLG